MVELIYFSLDKNSQYLLFFILKQDNRAQKKVFIIGNRMARLIQVLRLIDSENSDFQNELFQ